MSSSNQTYEANWDATFLLAFRLDDFAEQVGAPERNAVGTNILRALIQSHLLMDGIEAELCSAGYFNTSFYLVTVADAATLGAAMLLAKGIVEQMAPGSIWAVQMNGVPLGDFQFGDAVALHQCVQTALASQKEIAAENEHLLAWLKEEVKRLSAERDRLRNEGEDWKKGE